MAGVVSCTDIHKYEIQTTSTCGFDTTEYINIAEALSLHNYSVSFRLVGLNWAI